MVMYRYDADNPKDNVKELMQLAFRQAQTLLTPVNERTPNEVIAGTHAAQTYGALVRLDSWLSRNGSGNKPDPK